VDVPIEASTNAPLLCALATGRMAPRADGTQSKFPDPLDLIAMPAWRLMAGDSTVMRNRRRSRWVANLRESSGIDTPTATGCSACHGPGINEVTLHEGTHVVKFKVHIPRLDLLQVLEDQGQRSLRTPPSCRCGCVRQSFAFNTTELALAAGRGGDDEEIGGGWGHGRRH